MKWFLLPGLTAIAAMVSTATLIAPGFTQTPPKVVTRTMYKCDDGKGFKAEYLEGDELRATFGTKVFVLPKVESASGAKYSNGSVTISTKGDEALVDVGDKRLFSNCVSVGSVPGLW